MGKLMTGDMGDSIFFQTPVAEVLADGAETSIFLALMTMLWIVLVRPADWGGCGGESGRAA